ncbi:MAG: protein translocase subunit SecF [Candidatus Eremiobacteraeota bacterium]|nr:protein translocase subunit SecF [Candidatus Eremiobacteraeota bacterium]
MSYFSEFIKHIKPTDYVGMAIAVIVLIMAAEYAKSFRKKPFDVIGKRKYFFIGSGILVVISVLSLAINALHIGGGKLNYSLEFTGGTIVELGFAKQDITSENITKAVEEYNSTIENPVHKLKHPVVQMEGKLKTVEYPEKLKEVEVILKKTDGGTITASELNGIAAPFVDRYGKAQLLDSALPEGAEVKVRIGLPEIKKPSTLPGAQAPEALPAPDMDEAPKPSGYTRESIQTIISFYHKNLEVVEVKELELVAAPARIKDYKAAIIRITKEDNSNLSADDVLVLVSYIARLYGDVYKFKVESIGPSIGQELTQKALLAILVALLIQLVYITLRFGNQSRFGFAADIALFHDLVIMTGIYSIAGRELDSPFLAALLTVIGYSVMDSIVIFDRIRENLKIFKKETYEEAVNISVNQTMTRSVNTLLTVLITLFALYFFGGKTLQNFAFALLIGCTLGAYSSIFIASPIVVLIDEWVKKKEQERVATRRAALAAASAEKSARIKESAPQKQVSQEPASVEGGDEVSDEEARGKLRRLKTKSKQKRKLAKIEGKKK